MTSSCSLHPCVEFIQATVAGPPPRLRTFNLPRTTCTRYPSARGTYVPVG
jgi:hypothetical protein